MWRIRILAMMAVSLAAVATTIARAGDGDMRGEDRRPDWQHERKAEANLDVPRNADGSIDGQTFVNEVDSLVARGVKVIHFRDASITQEEARSLLIPLENNLIGHLAARLPNDGIQRQITLRGDVDVRVQRKANGELRASIKDLVVGNPTEARRAEFALQLAERYGLDRLSVRAIDAEGNRLRVEYRADQGIVRNESRPGHGGGSNIRADRGKDYAASDERRGDGKDYADHRKDRNSDRAEWRYDDKDRDERHAKVERAERPESREDRMQRSERHAKFERTERHERAERPERREDRMQRPERHARFERPERHERVERPERAERAARPERVERPDRSSRH
jgi:hypothetical protein